MSAQSEEDAGERLERGLMTTGNTSHRPDASELADVFACEYCDVVEEWPSPCKLPIVYNKGYNISFLGLAKLQHLDTWKFEHVVAALHKSGVVSREKVVSPVESSNETFADVHAPEYLKELTESRWRVIQVTELPGLTLLPNMLVQQYVMRPLRLHAAGTILAAGLAYERGWGINIGGGMHHASRDQGAGWCPFDDITLAVRRLRKATNGKMKKVLVVDLDAHQGNGYQKNKLYFEDDNMFIVDIYNGMIFPKDEDARKGIDIERQLKCGVGGEEYISYVQEALVEASKKFSPDLIMYNAGTDVFEDDFKGRLKLTWSDVVQRDELVFGHALQLETPICMTLSGGYGRKNAALIAASIQNLIEKFELH